MFIKKISNYFNPIHLEKRQSVNCLWKITFNFKNSSIRNSSALKFILILLFFLNLFPGTEISCFSQKDSATQKLDTSALNNHSPRIASFYSAVLPGLGQIYNKKYWKVPVIYISAGTLIYFIIDYNKQYIKYKNGLIWKLSGDPNIPKDYQFINDPIWYKENLQSAMDWYHRYRDIDVICLATLYILNILDASVDAYLFDYDISQDLSLQIRPTMLNLPNSYNFGLSCRLKF